MFVCGVGRIRDRRDDETRKVGGGMDAPPGEAWARRGHDSAKSPSGDSSRRRIRGRALALAIALTLHKYLVAPVPEQLVGFRIAASRSKLGFQK